MAAKETGQFTGVRRIEPNISNGVSKWIVPVWVCPTWKSANNATGRPCLLTILFLGYSLQTQMKTSVPTRVALLAAVVLVCYWPTLHGGFIFDDNVTLTENPLIRGARGISDIWFSRKAVDYWPVTSTSFWLEWRLWGTNASGYHVTNVIIHFCDCLLFWALLKRLRFQGAFFATLLFALHPLNAETVAWITQRKNLLSMFFFLISAHCFATGALREKIFARWIAVSLLAFVLAMLCKGSVVTMPLVLVGLVAWHRRLKRGDLVCFCIIFRHCT